MSHLNDSRARVMEFWRACELFSPPSLPRVDPRDEREPVFRVQAGALLPWEAGHPLQRRRIRPNMTWRYIVYGGVFQLERVRLLLEKVFGPDPENFDRAPQGRVRSSPCWSRKKAGRCWERGSSPVLPGRQVARCPRPPGSGLAQGLRRGGRTRGCRR
ncbi:hypothetical protein ACFQQB_18545 [Nonomuraea rubra]|uniref:hypothetical protein n=1 Tax=Nonomuraea rubra TaxID=46180 RepID=UPI0036146738